MGEVDEVHLIIKAPNQNYDDQTVECNLDWTVLELKEHLANEYPSKPPADEQKLIYSGRLLYNHLHLRDVLRLEDRSTTTHTLHLVCSRQSRPYYVPEDKSSHAYRRTPSSSSEGSQSSDSMDDFADRWSISHRSLGQSDASDDYSGSSGETSVRSTSPSVVSATASNASNTDDRDPAPTVQQTYADYFYQAQQFAPYTTSSPPPSFSWPFSPTPHISYDLTPQMAAYQQMYANYYTQCMQTLQSMSVQNGVPVVLGAQVNTVPVGSSANTGAAAAAAAPAQPAAEQNIRVNRARAPQAMDVNNNGNRDWLDYFYVWCRGFVLFSIVYFYSSPERLLLVVCLGLLAFLYQEGWLIARMRNNRVAENRQNVPQRPAATENQNNVDAVPQPPQPPNPDGDPDDTEQPQENEIEAIMDGEQPPHLPNHQYTNNQNPAWTFITSFFSSLIPEPPAPVNIN